MADNLRDVLLNRAPVPAGLPNEPAKVPPRVQRFETAEKMKDAYRAGWSPNPIIVRLLGGGNRGT